MAAMPPSCSAGAAGAGPDAGAAGAADTGADAGEADIGADAGEADIGADAGEADIGADAGEADIGADAGGLAGRVAPALPPLGSPAIFKRCGGIPSSRGPAPEAAGRAARPVGANCASGPLMAGRAPGFAAPAGPDGGA